jgi:hypothetical protein
LHGAEPSESRGRTEAYKHTMISRVNCRGGVIGLAIAGNPENDGHLSPWQEPVGHQIIPHTHKNGRGNEATMAGNGAFRVHRDSGPGRFCPTPDRQPLLCLESQQSILVAVHLSSIDDGTYWAAEPVFFDDWFSRVLGHQSEHHFDTITIGRLPTFDPPPYRNRHNRQGDRTRTSDQSRNKNCAVETIGGTIIRTTGGLKSSGFSNIRTAMGTG